MKIYFEKADITGMISIPRKLIDDYINKANGEYIKVYLYILRHWDKDISFSSIADALDMLERDVSRAISYWVKQGLISIDDDNDSMKEVNSINAKDKNETEAALNKHIEQFVDNTDLSSEESDKVKNHTIPDKNDIYMDKLEDDEEFKTLLYCTERYLSKVLTPTDVQIIAYMYESLRMPIELIEYLIETCLLRDKRSLRYMESIAIDWHSKGIKTVEAARLASDIYSSEVWSVLKAFGIRDRNPGKEELEYINKWFKEFAFSREIVLEACNRGLAKTSSQVFKYTDGILTSWYKSGVRTMADIENLDRDYKLKNIKIVDKKKPNSNIYNGFEQRDDDIDNIALEKMKLKLNKI